MILKVNVAILRIRILREGWQQGRALKTVRWTVLVRRQMVCWPFERNYTKPIKLLLVLICVRDGSGKPTAAKRSAAARTCSAQPDGENSRFQIG